MSIIFLDKYIKNEIVVCNSNCTKQEFCSEYEISPNAIKCCNAELRKGEYVLINNNPDIIYVVLPTDTLESIANKFNTSIEKIKQKNNINAIFIGQQLLI